MAALPGTRWALCAAIGVLFLTSAAEAQRQNALSERDVLRAVLAAVRQSQDLGDSPVLEDRALCGRLDEGCTGRAWVSRTPRSAALAGSLAAAIRGRVGRAEAVHQCGATPNTCRLVSASALVALGTPVVEADSATVTVQLWLPSPSARTPVYEINYSAVVRRTAGGELAATLRMTRIT